MSTSKQKLESQLKSVISKKEVYFRRLQSLYDLSKRLDDSSSLNSFKVKLESLEQTKEEFLKTVDLINELESNLNVDHEPNFQVLEAFDDLYCNILSASKDPRVSTNNCPTNSPNLQNDSGFKGPRLPKLSLPKFSGEIKEWPIFYECFRSLVHDNKSLNDVDKINYLVGQLTGTAASICVGIPPVGSNYQILWKTLVDKYQNSRVLAVNYLDQILDFKPLQTASANKLNSILIKCDTAYQALKKLDKINLLDFTYAHLIWTKLDPETRTLFENMHRNSQSVSYDELMGFIREQTQIYEISPLLKKSTSSVSSKSKAFFNKTEKNTINCNLCQSNKHSISRCEKFLGKSPSERFEFVKQKNLCIGCFGSHRVNQCKSSTVCQICQYKHNTLLHFIKPHSDVAVQKGISSDLKPTTSTGTTTTSLCSMINSYNYRHSTVLLSTIVVNILDSQGIAQRVRFLLDSGSQANFMTLDCAKKINLDIKQCNSSVKGMGASNNFVIGKSNTVVVSRFDSRISYPIDVFLVEKITDKLPDYEICSDSLEHLVNLPLSDDTFDTPGPIDGIIGAQLFPKILLSRKVTGSVHAPIAVETEFGFVVMGSAPTNICKSKSTKSFYTQVDPSLNDLVSKFWETEDIPQQKFEHPDDVECEKIYRSSVQRDKLGRYIVKLPFKLEFSKLGNSFDTALKRFYALERKFCKSSEFKEQYTKVMETYLREGYMSLVKPEALKIPNYFIPHHGVSKPDSTSTPLRCVFDASAKTTRNVSLNDLLYTGPKLQKEVFNIFLNFRLFSVAFTADVRQMYLRIGVHSEHRRFQQILWRFSQRDPISIYQLNTVTFGVKPSPYLALRTLHQLAIDGSESYPLAAEMVKRDFYMDDLVSSVDSLDEALLLYDELVNLFKTGQFQLTKWAVNSPEFLTKIPEEERCPKFVDFNSDGLKVLGLHWYPKFDVFVFRISRESRLCTKRNVLSVVARLFDSLGFGTPVTLLFKLFVRKMWSLKLDWDEIPDGDLPLQWKNLQNELQLLENFQISRHLGASKNSKLVLIGFGDACIDSYGAVVYAKTIAPNGEVRVTLVCAKTKVSSLNVSHTIPRLELSAAVLVARLLSTIKTTLELRVEVDEIIALSDSMVALNWIAAPPSKWQTFVANRVSVIKELVPQCKWFHVRGENNISDCLSRAMTPSQFLNRKDWLSGPSWLEFERDWWPIQKVQLGTIDVPEQKTVSLLAKSEQLHPLYDLINRCSSFTKLLRSTVYVLRFLKILKSSGLITASDLEKAEIILIKVVQIKHFSLEFALLKNKKICSSLYRSLSPFLEDGLIRVGGRLTNSQLNYGSQHPLLLPKKDNFVDLLIDHCHRKNLHTGPYLVSAILRQKYWIVGGRNAVRFRLQKCNHCFRVHPRAEFPKMADLPAVRVTEAKPFLHTGVDYSGAFLITMGRGRGFKGRKAYLCLFVCLVTKAIHLELASDLSTDTFLAALKRFLARRGACSVIYSDNATNFIGAKNELDALYKLVNSNEYLDRLQEEAADRKITWKFQPPLSPHFSGIWESQIKAVKTHLYKIIGLQILTYEELSTVLTQIEALLNSRPLSWLSTDPADPIPLTPAHFLTYTPLQSLPATEVPNPPKNLFDRKRLLDHLVQGFWKRWHNEYLTQLQRRQKWNISSSDIKSGTLVLLRQDNVAPLSWPVGVVEELFPGNDGVTRVVNVRTKTGVFKRPVVRLCPLPSQ